MSEMPASQRGQEAYGELFASADTILDWLKELHPRDRPIARFNRLNDAIDRVREAHQMHGFDFAPAPPASPTGRQLGPGKRDELPPIVGNTGGNGSENASPSQPDATHRGSDETSEPSAAWRLTVEVDEEGRIVALDHPLGPDAWRKARAAVTAVHEETSRLLRDQGECPARPDTDLVCTVCRRRAGHSPDCPHASEPWPRTPPIVSEGVGEKPMLRPDLDTYEAMARLTHLASISPGPAGDDLRSLLSYIRELEGALESAALFIEELAAADLDDVAADGGITVGMVFQQQARTVFGPRARSALSKATGEGG